MSMIHRRGLFPILGILGATISVFAVLILLYIPIAQESSGYTILGPRQ